MRTLSVRHLASSVANARDPFQLASDKIRGFFKRIEANRRRRRARFALLLVRVDMASWHETNSIPVEDRVRLAHRFRRTLYPFYYVSLVMDKRLETAMLTLIIISGACYFAVLPYYGRPAGSSLSYMQAIFASAIGSAMLYGAVTGLMTLTAKFLEADATLARRLGVIGSAVLALIAAGLLSGQLSTNTSDTDPGAQTLRLVLLGVLGFGIILFFWASLYAVLLMAVRGWSHSRHPEAYVVRRLFYALRKLEARGSGWSDPGLRSEVIADIDGASILIRRSLFRNFRTQDPATFRWRERQAKRISAALSEKQRWLITPKADTREVLLGWLARSVVALLSGAWDELELAMRDEETADREHAAPARRWVDMVLSSLRTLAVALLPVLLFIIARRLDLLHEMATDLQGYVELALLAWGALVLLFMLDPGGMKEWISTMREAISLLRPDRKTD